MPHYEAPAEDRTPQRGVPTFSNFLWRGRTENWGGEFPSFLHVDEVPEAAEEVLITLRMRADIGNPLKGAKLEANGELLGDFFYLPWGEAFGCTDSDFVEIRLSAHVFNTYIRNNLFTEPERIFFSIFPVGNPDPWACHSITWVDITLEFIYATTTVEPLDLKMWGEDLCQNVVLSPTFLPDEMSPVLQSTHPVRAMAQAPNATEEVCAYHRGELVIDRDKFARGFYCSQPVSYSADEDQQNHYADLFIIQQHNTVLSEQVPKGFGCFLGAYHAPRWTETQLWSHAEICTAEI